MYQWQNTAKKNNNETEVCFIWKRAVSELRRIFIVEAIAASTEGKPALRADIRIMTLIKMSLLLVRLSHSIPCKKCMQKSAKWSKLKLRDSFKMSDKLCEIQRERNENKNTARARSWDETKLRLESYENCVKMAAHLYAWAQKGSFLSLPQF